MRRYAFFEAGKQKHKNAQNRCFTQFSQNFKSIELPHKMFETSPNFNTNHFLYKGNFLGGETMTIQNFENKHHPTVSLAHRAALCEYILKPKVPNCEPLDMPISRLTIANAWNPQGA